MSFLNTPGSRSSITTTSTAIGMPQNSTLHQEAVAAGPHPTGGSDCGSEAVHSVKYYSQAVAGPSTGVNDGCAVTNQPSSQKHQIGRDSSITVCAGFRRYILYYNYLKCPYKCHFLEECPMCLSEPTDPVKTKCGHVFCKKCLNRSLQFNSFCLTCKTALKTIVGNQPVGGRMTVKVGLLPFAPVIIFCPVSTV